MKRITFYIITLFILLLTACEKYDMPTVSTPIVGVVNTITNTKVEIDFEITAEAGYLSSSVAAELGSASHHTDIGEGAVQGLIYITYTAGSETGTDYVTFIVMDKESNTAKSIVEITVI